MPNASEETSSKAGDAPVRGMPKKDLGDFDEVRIEEQVQASK